MHFSTVVGNNFCVTGFPHILHSTVIFWQQNTVLQGNYKEIFKIEIDSEKIELHLELGFFLSQCFNHLELGFFPSQCFNLENFYFENTVL